MDGVMDVGRTSALRQLGTFGQHFLEMCVAMCVGVGLANVALGALRATALPDPRAEWPVVAVLALAFLISVPMIAWMRFRGMAWRPIVEMTAAGLAVIVVALTLGVISTAVAVGTLCGLECAGMFVAMLFRLDLYRGRHGHHTGHHSAMP